MNAALEGIRVIETASGMAGPMAGRLLADWGADVIHVEPTVTGDMGREARRLLSDLYQRLPGGRNIEADFNYSYENHNCNKRSMTLNLSQKTGQDILYRLLEKADIFLANFRPKELNKFNISYDKLSQVNPKLIFANVTGYGEKGADKDLPGYDFNAFWARSGILRVLLSPDMTPPVTPIAIGDRVTALALVSGITTALFTRERTGKGQEVNTSLLNTGIFVNANDIGGALITGQDRQNVKRDELANALLNTYQTKDARWLCIAINQPDRYWTDFCRAIERNNLEHDLRFESFDSRIDNHLALFQILEKVFREKDLDEWRVRLTEVGLPWAPIATLSEVIADPQARENNAFVSYEHHTQGNINIVANPVHLGDTPASIRMPAPEYGQHTEEVLLEHGYNWDDITRFKDNGVIA